MEGGKAVMCSHKYCKPVQWVSECQECRQDMDQQHPVGLSHSPSSVGPVPGVVLKNNNKVERSHDSCREISERWPLTETKVGWSPQGFSFPFCSLVDADIIYIRCGLVKSVRKVSRKEKKKMK